MNQGVYKVFGNTEDERGRPERVYYGRLAVIGGHTQVLEDHHDGLLPHMFPDGVVDARKSARLANLQGSPYFDVVPEGLVDDAEPKEMQMPKAVPDEVFAVVDQHGQQQHMEVFGDDVFLDGRHLGAREIELLQTQVRNKEIHLIPKDI